MPVVFASLDPASVIVTAAIALVTTLATLRLRFKFEERLLRRRADTDYELLRRRADTEYEFERRRQLRKQIGQYHGPLLSAVDAFSDRLENLTRHHGCGWLDDARDEHGQWSDRYYFRSTVVRFMRLMALVFAFEREAIFVDASVAEPDDTRFLIYARTIRFAMTDVRLFAKTGYRRGEQTDHFFTDDLRQMCSRLTAGGQEIDLDRLDTMLRGEHRLDPVMAYFHGLTPRTLKWDRLFALQTVLLAFMNDFGHQVQHSSQKELDRAIMQINNPKVVANLREWLPRIGCRTLGSSSSIFAALNAHHQEPTT